ncbi:MAG: peptidoglycan-binding protein, partial [Candidatus Sungbacteria bacterium]|nr:peptidoglycan-binding protein [Candidatus Sungbacteria bacterium]
MRLFLFVIFTVVLPFVASATTIPETIRIILPTDGSEYNLNGGSSFNTLTIDSTKFTFEIPAGGSVELISQDKKNLSNDGSYSVICNSNDSRLVMSVATGGATKTVIVTPSGTCSTSVSGGGNPSIGATFGGGGGGGGGGVSTPAGTTSPTPSPASASTSTVAVAPAPVTVSLPSTTSIPAPVPASINFEKDLAYGMENNDVSRLQALLADDKSIYPEGIVSGYFGPATQRAVKRFQAKYGLPQVG